MDDPIQMVTFARVVEAGSFALAARRLAVSTSVASKHVAKLERELGPLVFACLSDAEAKSWCLQLRSQ